MIFTETKLTGAYIIHIERLEDDRGFFGRAWCKREFESKGLNPSLVQMNVGFSKRKGTLRGVHYQKAPWAEAKLVRCTMGAVYDVIVDLRPDSPTYKQWIGIELTQDNRAMLYAPEGFAHGYQSLRDESEIYYQTTQFYSPDCAWGVRYNDPMFQIAWPMEVTVISERDKTWPDYCDRGE